MAINSSSTLNAGLGATLDEAYVFDESSAGKVREIVSNTEKTVTLNGSAAFSSDAGGDYIDMPTASDNAEIADTYTLGGGDYTAIIVFDPSTVTPGDWRGIYAHGHPGTGQISTLGRDSGSNDLHLTHDTSSVSITNGLTKLTAATRNTVVITFDATANALKVFFDGEVSPISASIGDPYTGPATVLRLANTAGGDGGFPGKYRFYAMANTKFSDANAQAVADDVETGLFATGGGGAITQPYSKRFGGVPGAALIRGVW